MSKTVIHKCDIHPCVEVAEVVGQNIHYLKTTSQSEDRLITLDKPLLNTAEIDLCERHIRMYKDSLMFKGSDNGRLEIIFEER